MSWDREERFLLEEQLIKHWKARAEKLKDERNEFRHILRDSEYDRSELVKEKENLKAEVERLNDKMSDWVDEIDCGSHWWVRDRMLEELKKATEEKS